MNNQTLFIKDRNILEVNNVKNIISFDPNIFLVETNLGNLNIKGKNLALVKMDNEKQELVVKGNIDCVCYLKDNKNPNDKKENFFVKLFK